MLELIARAESPEALDAVTGEGADAVVVGLDNINTPVNSGNFTYSQFEGALRGLHRRGKKLYAAVDMVFEQREADRVYQLLKYLDALGTDALIVQDFGLVAMARSCFPSLKMHASARMNIAGTRGVNALSRYGFSRIELARELSPAELEEIRAGTNMELEVLVHGVLCISASGLCLFSGYLGGKSANRNMCTHACRRLYHRAVDEARAGDDTIPASGYYFSPNDLQLLQRVPDLAAAGINAVKIESRIKSAGTVVAAYRMVVDAVSGGNQDKIRQSILQGQEMLRGDCARPKTEFYFSGGVNPGTAENISAGVSIDWLNPAQDDSVRPIQGKTAVKRYRPVCAPNTGGGRSPGREKAPAALIEPPAASGVKISKKADFPEGLYVAVSRTEDLYVLQSARPERVLLTLNSKSSADMLSENKPLFPFKPNEIILVLPPFFPQAISETMAKSIEQLVKKGYRQFVVNNPGHFSLFRIFNDIKLIAGPWLYMFNRWAFSFFSSCGVSGFVSPLENNRQNLERTATSIAERSRFFVTVFSRPPLFTIRSNLACLYNFSSFSDSRNDLFSLISSPDGSAVFPEIPFSISDKIPFLREAGFRRFIIDLSVPPIRKSDYRDLMRAFTDGIPLPHISRFNWKDGFFHPAA